MEKRRCGSSGLELPVVGVGVWAFGGGSYWGEQDQGEVDRIVARALDLGCGFFDTAEMYNEGRSEESLGKALAGRRSQALICSKIPPDHCQPEAVIQHCDASLRRLGTDHVDLYLIHWPLTTVKNPPRLDQTIDAMRSLQAAGKVRFIGVSNYGPRQLEELRSAGAHPACNELPYSLLARAIEHALMPVCERTGIGIIAYMPLMQGLLTGRYASADDLPANRARTRQFRGDRPGSRHGEPGFEELTFRAVRAIRGLCDQAGMPMERAALAWCAARFGVTCTIAGARTVAQLEENAKAGETRLSDDLLSALDAATDELKQAMGPSVDLFESAANTRTW
ncbi:MAG TPA: aldo/keto reductase [Spirochaetia bacterium]|nr:aldo/keto reductase [Spirochaetia bacterium]